MVEGLYQIDWSQLTHAYGEAVDVPGLILALASPEQEDRDMAFEMLRDNIWNRGAVFEATAYAVPFLIQLLEHPGVEDKGRLLVFLAQLSTGDSPLDVLRAAGLLNLDEADPDVRLRVAMERNWARVTRRAVRRGMSVYQHNLESLEPDDRTAAAYLLACFHQESARLAPQLIRRLGFERHPLAQASLVLALGILDIGNSGHLGILSSIQAGDLHPLVRLAAAMVLARTLREQTPDSVLETLVDGLSSYDPELPALYARLPWADSHLFGDLSLVLCYLGQRRAHLILPDMLGALQRVDPVSAVNVAYALLYLAFGPDAAIDPRALGDPQLAVLASLAESDVMGETPDELAEILQMFNLPDSVEGLRKFQ